jgi:hypothetical protein
LVNGAAAGRGRQTAPGGGRERPLFDAPERPRVAGRIFDFGFLIGDLKIGARYLLQINNPKSQI